MTQRRQVCDDLCGREGRPKHADQLALRIDDDRRAAMIHLHRTVRIGGARIHDAECAGEPGQCFIAAGRCDEIRTEERDIFRQLLRSVALRIMS